MPAGTSTRQRYTIRGFFGPVLAVWSLGFCFSLLQRGRVKKALSAPTATLSPEIVRAMPLHAAKRYIGAHYGANKAIKPLAPLCRARKFAGFLSQKFVIRNFEPFKCVFRINEMCVNDNTRSTDPDT
jgi:hypothetical protein